MQPALMTAVSHETQPKDGPYLYQEWITKRKLKMLNTEILSLLAGKPECFHSDVATSSGGELAEQSDFWETTFRFIEVKIYPSAENKTRIDRDYERELEAQRSAIATSITPPIYEAEEDLLDWDAHIEKPPPPKQSGTIKVRFKYIGRSKPIPIENPWA